MEKKLEVKNLRVSFKTANGKVQAVRDVSFDLNKGETIAIVGESGSGKSVTSKAILGILAGNSIIEGGEIIYDGKDLLKITEDEFYRIRGDRIAMIFQDPLSSLNPIMRIGKQLTEAMILKGKARQRASKLAFNSTLKLLNETMIAANPDTPAEQFNKKCKDFDAFEFKHIEIEKSYNEAVEAANEALSSIDDGIFLIEKNALTNFKEKVNDVASLASKTFDKYVVADGNEATLKDLISQLKAVKKTELDKMSDILKDMRSVLSSALEREVPNFFRMGYFLKFANEPLPEMPVKELDAYLLKYLNDNFMLDFLASSETALRYSAKVHDEKKAAVIKLLNESLPVFSKASLDKAECKEWEKKLSVAVNDSIDRLEINKDSVAYTFASGLKSAIDSYFAGIERNKASQRAHDKQQAKYDRLCARGKKPDWKVIPAALVDLDASAEDIRRVIIRLRDRYTEVLAAGADRDFARETVALVDFFKSNASDSVNKVTKGMAKHKALRLMEEVGIPEPRKRYKQYPFEFSGGMRQRIVIAIALAANPDILICDEPTTALDVTIQAQILELINKIKAERQLSIIFITHDLGVVANMADRIAVMYAGKIVEYGTSEDIFYSPAHPYTWALLSSMPDLDTNEKLEAIPGTPPNMIYPPVGDAFADRNKYALEIDFELQPPMFKISETHSAATWLLHPDAPKAQPPKIILDRIARMKQRGEVNNG